MTFDFWYNIHTITDVDRIEIFWSDTRLLYTGWMYKNNEIIGDFTSPTCQEIEETFKHLNVHFYNTFD